MSQDDIELEKDLKLIAPKVRAVKEAGHGEVVIKIANGKVTYTILSIGEQVNKEVK